MMAGELTREQVVGIVESLTSDKVDGVLAYDLLTHDALLRQRVEALEQERNEAMGALGYPVPGDTPCGRLVCGLCGPRQEQIDTLTAKLEACEQERDEAHEDLDAYEIERKNESDVLTLPDRLCLVLERMEQAEEERTWPSYQALQRQLQEREEELLATQNSLQGVQQALGLTGVESRPLGCYVTDLRARLDVLEGALKDIAEDDCAQPFGILCHKTSGGETWCSSCKAKRTMGEI